MNKVFMLYVFDAGC